MQIVVCSRMTEPRERTTCHVRPVGRHGPFTSASATSKYLLEGES